MNIAPRPSPKLKQVLHVGPPYEVLKKKKIAAGRQKYYR